MIYKGIWLWFLCKSLWKRTLEKPKRTLFLKTLREVGSAVRAQNNPKIREQLVLILTWWFVIGILIKIDFSDFVGVGVITSTKWTDSLNSIGFLCGCQWDLSSKILNFARSRRSGGLAKSFWAQNGVEFSQNNIKNTSGSIPHDFRALILKILIFHPKWSKSDTFSLWRLSFYPVPYCSTCSLLVLRISTKYR